MPRDSFTRHVLWYSAVFSSSEYATLREGDGEVRLTGLTVLPLDGTPCKIDYEVVADEGWRTTAATIVVTTPARETRIALTQKEPGRWALDGAPAPWLADCTDVDLGWTPATNTLPIRRAAVPTGGSVTIAAAWVRYPELEVVASRQRYTRLALDRWRYESGTYDFELATDAASGLVLAYGDDLWRATGLVGS